MKNYYSLLVQLSFIFLSFNLVVAQSNNQSVSAPSNCIASPLPVDIVQPDNSLLTIIGKGNMNNSWTETTDGYSIVRNTSGIYEYATKLNGELIPDGIKAHDPLIRTNAELSYLSNVSFSIKPDLSPLKSSILNQVRAQIKNKTYPTSGNLRVLALLIDYPDLQNTFPASNFDSLLYGANYRNGDGSFKVFYETSSDSLVTIQVDVFGWYRADSSYIYYGRDSGYSRAADLVREAVDAAEIAGVDFSNYDNDSDNDVDGILTVHSGPGAERGSRTQYIWSHRWILNGGTSGQVTYDGVRINDYIMNPEVITRGTTSTMIDIGVFCHEFGHNLGLPDLYDTDDSNGDSEGIGEWGMMGSATYLGGGHQPGNFCAWSKLDLGWVNPTVLTIGNSGNYSLRAASKHLNEVFRINTSLSNEYFLLENRQKTGLDTALRGNGLAIWHISSTKTNSTGNIVNGDEALKGVDLEEADGNNDLDNKNNRGDTGDLFPGSSNNSTFDGNSTPNSKDYQLNGSNIEIRNISESNNILSFSFGAASGPPCAASSTFTNPTGSFSDGSSDSLEYANNQNCSWLIQPTTGVVTLNFSYFRTELKNDSVSVYDGIDAAAPLLGNFSGTSIPSAVTSSGNSMFIEFNTNSTISDTGWVASYTSTTDTIIASPDTIYLSYLANSAETFNIIATSSWTSSDNAGWLSVSPSSGTGNAVGTAEATQVNLFNQERVGKIYVNSSDSSRGDTVIVVQSANENLIVATPDTLLFKRTPLGSQNISITSNVSWNLASAAAWLSLSATSGSNNGISSVTASTNSTNQVRSGLIIISGTVDVLNDTIIVFQDTARTIGLAEFKFEEQLKLYPNPTNGNVTLEFNKNVNANEVSFELYSTLGAKIENLKVSRIGSKAELKLKPLAKGIYFLQMNYKGKLISRKISVIK